MATTGSRNHIDLYNQNIGVDNISLSLKGDFKPPAIVVAFEKARESDIAQLRSTLILTEGDYNLYLSFKGKQICIGKTYKNIKNYCCITNAIDNCNVYEVVPDPEDTSHIKTSELTLDDIMTTLVIGQQHLKEYPELHLDYLKEHYLDHKQIIADNKELFAIFIEEHKIEFAGLLNINNINPDSANNQSSQNNTSTEKRDQLDDF